MYTDEITLQMEQKMEQNQEFQDLCPLDAVQKIEQKAEQNQIPTISVKLNDCYIMIKQTEAQLKYQSKQEWQDLLSKQFQQRVTAMNVIALNSIISIKHTESQLRSMIWQRMLDQLKFDQSQQSLLEEPQPKIIKQIQINVQKMFKRISIANQQSSIQLKFLLTQIISIYEQKQKHLGNIKGLEYVCYGIYIASPSKQFSFLYKTFAYVMDILKIKCIYYHGSPLFYSQLNILCAELKNQAYFFYTHLENLNTDWSKIFVAYYKSLLLNKIKNKYVIIKIIDLILVYGINMVRMILIKIILQNQEDFINYSDSEKLMQTLGTDLLYLQFQETSNTRNNKQQIQKQQQQQKSKQNIQKVVQSKNEEQEVIKKFRKLIIGV